MSQDDKMEIIEGLSASAQRFDSHYKISMSLVLIQSHIYFTLHSKQVSPPPAGPRSLYDLSYKNKAPQGWSKTKCKLDIWTTTIAAAPLSFFWEQSQQPHRRLFRLTQKIKAGLVFVESWEGQTTKTHPEQVWNVTQHHQCALSLIRTQN